MMKLKRICIIWLMLLVFIPAMAQKLTGVIVDDNDGEYIPYASAVYRGNHVMVSSDAEGRFSIDRHNGWKLTFSAVGYKPLTIQISQNTKSPMRISLKPEKNQLEAVTVTGKRGKYSRKDNPAVELMKRVIAAKKKTNLGNHDYYQYNKYQKLTLAFNDVTPADLESGFFKKKQWAIDQLELCHYNNKLILPVSVDETASRVIYRKDPKNLKTIIMGQKSTGLNDLFETGEMLTTTLKDVFTDVDLYDNQIRLLQHPFTSPIADNAITFYRYYIEDTTFVDTDKCYHLQFMPNNQQDFGFRGDLYVIADSSLHVRKCTLTIPKKSDVNFVDNLQVFQEYRQLDNGEWVLDVDDMVVEMSVVSFLSKAVVIRTTRTKDYDFTEINKKLFKGKQKERHEANAQMRDEEFWNQYRAVQLTKSERSMDDFIKNIQNIKGFKYIIFGLRALVENYIDTGSKDHPSKIDIGPVNTTITKNFIDGWRTRLSAQTTANLNPHWYVSGYYAHGWKSKKDYYKGTLTYSFNKKEYLPNEFPQRTLTFTSTYDVASPSDKFVQTDKDNVFTAFKWAKVDKMMFYNRQQLTFEWEEEIGFKGTLSLKTEENEACGGLHFTPIYEWKPTPANVIETGTDEPFAMHNGKIRTTELMAMIRFAPGETYLNTKQRRFTVNLDAPVFTLSHTFGFKGLLGGEYAYNFTEATMFKRFWLPFGWGKIDGRVKGGIQWNKVPFPLLIMPAANLSYIFHRESFSLVNNMEFLNDRYVSAEMLWDMSGKVFNRIPLLKKLQWRERFGVNMLWGTLTDKNNPMLEMNRNDRLLMAFPEGSFVMDSHQPYFELLVGIHNIFKVLEIDYVRRLNYLDLPTANKDGIRVTMHFSF